MKHYIIDGNNLIGKIPELFSLQKSDPQMSRQRIAFSIDRYFLKKNIKVSLHFDGFESEKIKTTAVKILYSDNQTADERIKLQIEKSRNTKNIVVITSDNNLSEFAKVCRCTTIRSEEFTGILMKDKNIDEEKLRIEQMNDPEEFKRLFGAK